MNNRPMQQLNGPNAAQSGFVPNGSPANVSAPTSPNEADRQLFDALQSKTLWIMACVRTLHEESVAIHEKIKLVPGLDQSLQKRQKQQRRPSTPQLQNKSNQKSRETIQNQQNYWIQMFQLQNIIDTAIKCVRLLRQRNLLLCSKIMWLLENAQNVPSSSSWLAWFNRMCASSIFVEFPPFSNTMRSGPLLQIQNACVQWLTQCVYVLHEQNQIMYRQMMSPIFCQFDSSSSSSSRVERLPPLPHQDFGDFLFCGKQYYGGDGRGLICPYKSGFKSPIKRSADMTIFSNNALVRTTNDGPAAGAAGAAAAPQKSSPSNKESDKDEMITECSEWMSTNPGGRIQSHFRYIFKKPKNPKQNRAQKLKYTEEDKRNLKKWSRGQPIYTVILDRDGRVMDPDVVAKIMTKGEEQKKQNLSKENEKTSTFSAKKTTPA